MESGTWSGGWIWHLADRPHVFIVLKWVGFQRSSGELQCKRQTCVVRSCFRPPSAFFPSLVESSPNQALANALAKGKYQAMSTSARNLPVWYHGLPVGLDGRVMVERQDQGTAQARSRIAYLDSHTWPPDRYRLLDLLMIKI